MKKLFSSIATLAIMTLLAFPAPALAADEGSVDGQFGVNSPPTVDSVSLTETGMIPQQTYTVSVQVSDADSINDLSSVVLKLWYDSDGGTPTVMDFNGAAADVQNCAVITWTADDPGGTTYTGSAALEPEPTSWELGAGTLPDGSGDFNATTFNFQLTFTVGKVATETGGGHGWGHGHNHSKWQIMAKATDSFGQNDHNYDTESSDMNWYGEINVPSALVDWGELVPGINFTDPGSEQPLGVAVTYLSNGDYQEKVKSSAVWGGTSHDANLDASGHCNNPQEFALKANDGGYAESVLIDTNGVTIDDSGSQTDESGIQENDNNFWLRMADSFADDVYQGTITFIIANG